MILALLTLLLSLVVTPAYATVYWAATTGTDSNAGGCGQIDSTSDTSDPGVYGSIRRAAECATVAGDVVNIKPGTYTNLQTSRIATSGLPGGLLTAAGLKSGTSETNRTIVQGVPGQTKPVIQVATACITFYTGLSTQLRDYITIRHLVCDGTGANDWADGGALVQINGGHHVTLEDMEIRNSCFHGITTFNNNDTDYTHHFVVRNSIIHHTNRCGYPGQQLHNGSGYGIYSNSPDSLFENVEWHHIPSIQLTSSWPNKSVPRQTFIHNYIHDVENTGTNRCWGIAGEGTDNFYFGNIIDLRGCPHGTQALYTLGSAADNTRFYHNLLLLNSNQTGIQIGNSGGSGVTGNIIRNNVIIGSSTSAIQLYDNNNAPCTNGVGTCPTVTIQGNKTSGALTDCTSSSSTFTHKTGSSCIDQGVDIAGFSFNGTHPDQGPFETFPCTSAVATSTSNSVDVTCAMSINVPILPSTGQTGWVVKFSGVARTTTSAVPISDSIVRITFNGAACAPSDTMTVDYTAGNVTDFTNVGGSLGQAYNQPLLNFTALAVVEAACGGGGGTPPAGGLLIYYPLNEGTGTVAVDSEATGGVQSGTLTNGPTWGTESDGTGAVVFADLDDNYIAVPYGSGVNPSTQSITVCMSALPESSNLALTRMLFGAQYSGSNRAYIGWLGGKWGIGIQGSPMVGTSEFAVAAQWTHVCLRMDSGTDQAHLFINGVKGTTADVAKTYTSYTLTGNFRLGQDGQWPDFYSGSTIGYFKLWDTALTDNEIADEFENWFTEPPATTGTFTQVAHQFQLLRVDSNGAAINYRSQNASSVNIIAAGAVALIIQTDCTTANCDPISQRLVYSRNGGTFTPVPDTCGADGVCFHTNAIVDPSVVKGVATCCLTGALTANDGTTLFSSSAIPSFDLTQNSSIVQRYIIKFTEQTAGTTFDFRVQNQNGTDYATPTPSNGARATIEAMSFGSGF